ncbi:MAG: NAD(+)/NADH kinase [Myxococcales bacterium]|nr:NAD(+)/NADH kinase [Myxococcales bacterium]
MQSVGLCVKVNHPEAGGTVRGLSKWLAARRLTVLLDEDAGELIGSAGRPREVIAEEADLLVVLGGDGTLLSVARASGERAVPILGVNLGTLGFLTEVTHDELYAALERVLAGDARIESRMRLAVTAERAGESLGRWLALNDSVITAQALARMLDIEASVEGRKLTTYHADGLIAATPTGSTAYSLSVGGPIVDPAMDAIVLSPISPHTLTQRPLVLPGDREIEIRPSARAGGLQLTIDGQEGARLQEGDVVRVTRSDHPALLVCSPFRTRFDILRKKLHWGER